MHLTQAVLIVTQRFIIRCRQRALLLEIPVNVLAYCRVRSIRTNNDVAQVSAVNIRYITVQRFIPCRIKDDKQMCMHMYGNGVSQGNARTFRCSRAQRRRERRKSERNVLEDNSVPDYGGLTSHSGACKHRQMKRIGEPERVFIALPPKGVQQVQ